MTNATAPVELGRYTLLQPIGRGGFGVVYRAFDPMLGRELAKVLFEADPRGARTAARESLATFRSMGARARAAGVRAWVEAHAAR